MEYHIGQVEVERIVAADVPVKLEGEAGDGPVGLVGPNVIQGHAPVVAGCQVHHLPSGYVRIVQNSWPVISVSAFLSENIYYQLFSYIGLKICIKHQHFPR